MPARVAKRCLWALACVALAAPLAGALEDVKPAAEKGVQTVPAFYGRLTGDWAGSYSLWLRPGVPVQEYKIKARSAAVAQGHYFLMTYTWKNDKLRRAGVFLLGGKGTSANTSWGDSFHMASQPLLCRGQLSKDGKTLVFRGKYAMGGGPAWGWRTEFTLQGKDAILMQAFNIHPSGQEMKAVEAKMRRTAKERK